MTFHSLRLSFLLMLVGAVTAVWPSTGIAQTFPPTWSSTSSYATGDIVLYQGNWYQATTAVASGGAAPSGNYNKWELNYVRANTTLAIGAKETFTTFQTAWQFAENCRIAQSAYLHFAITSTEGSAYNYFSSAFSLDHGSGAQISIIGNSPFDVTLAFDLSSGFTLDSGHSIGLISGVSIIGYDGFGERYPAAYTTYSGLALSGGASVGDIVNTTFEYCPIGISASSNSTATLSSTCLFKYCPDGIVADTGAAITCSSVDFTCNNGTTIAISANHGAQVVDQDAKIDNASKGTSIGADAQNGAAIDLTGSTLTGFDIGGLAEYKGFINLNKADISACTDSVYVDYGGGASVAGATLGDPTHSDPGDGSLIVGTPA